ncbi:reverse transcriptase domain-containing protein [Tanacetum coccineum]|uniref:Reverse transcriptase domain-containing protein n=1 Tax=Tanacetum coccineum TaxID=301880 RepID=A0ABQ5B007_9ASTR
MENLRKTSWKDTRQKSWTWKELRNAISGFMYGITHLGLIKRLYERIPRSMDEMYRMTTSFLQGEVAAFSHGRRKASSSWKQSEGGTNRISRKASKTNKDRIPWERVVKPRITQSFSPETAISFPPLGKEDGTEGPMIIEAEMGGHFMHRIYVDGGASSEVLYEHCFVKLCKEIRDQMVPATTHLIGFSGETIWPLGQIALLVKIGNEVHSTSAWMNFMIISIAEHRLNIREGYLPVRQKKRGHAPERNKVIQEEVEKLVDAGIMKEVHYDSWLSNSVMVKKHDGTWQMCVDFKDLNNTCPKDCYPLLEIDWKVESLCGYPFKCFLDAYKGYHQIKMAKEDEEKTAFITSQGIFCYSKMPFGLKNDGSTYQRLVDKAFQRQIGRNLEEGMFLGYKVSTNGLRACLDKADTVLSLQSPRCIKDVQKINGKLASLNRPRTAIKGQILADFIMEQLEERSSDELMAEPKVLPELWTLFTDGSSYVNGSGVGLILTNPERAECTYAMRFRFEATNNETKYEALVAGLRIAEQIGVKNLQAHVDSRLVANQVNGSYIAKESGMVQYLNKVKTLAKSFKEFSIKQIPRSENKKADALSKIASTSFAHLSKQVLVEELKEKFINEKEILDVVEEEGNTWMTPICEYLAKEILQEDKKKARMWGIDIAGPFPEGPGKVKFLIVAIDYFTKWIEAKAVATITGNQFRDNPFKDWCEKLCIRQCFASMKHPQANGLVERADRSLGEGIKARLDERSKDWIEELPHVLWAYRTMIKSSNGETPFSLTYGTKVVISAEIGMPTLWTTDIDLTKDNKALEMNLDLIEERREQAAIQEAKSKKKMEKYYNSRVRGTSFKPGDMVYRSDEASHAKDEGKLGPKWEGPYEVKESLGKGAYKLKDCKGNEMPRTWNICNLKKCYIHEV